MHRSLSELLVDPETQEPLALNATECDRDDVVSGYLTGSPTTKYPIIRGIPRFVENDDADQQQTSDSFGFKWNQRMTFESASSVSAMRDWLVSKYKFGTHDAMRSYFATRTRILDAGCGAALSSSTWLDESWPGTSETEWFGADISRAIDVARDRIGADERRHFLQADIMKLPFPDESFDTIFSEGVLHHTPSTRRAIRAVARHLKSGGEFLFYVYRRKGPIREFTDDFIRDAISNMAPQDAWESLRPLTELGQQLAGLKTTVEVPDVPLLGIKGGQYDVQRLLYWNFAKMFWSDGLTFEENHHVNFDWYHPKYAHRQTAEEVRQWCEEASLSIIHFHEQESGFAVRAIKN